MGSGRFSVTPEELHHAGGTLASVESGFIGQRSHGALSATQAGSPALATALGTFMLDAEEVAAALVGVVREAAGRVTKAGDGYQVTDATAIPAYEGPH